MTIFRISPRNSKLLLTSLMSLRWRKKLSSDLIIFQIQRIPRILTLSFVRSSLQWSHWIPMSIFRFHPSKPAMLIFSVLKLWIQPIKMFHSISCTCIRKKPLKTKWKSRIFLIMPNSLIIALIIRLVSTLVTISQNSISRTSRKFR